MRQSIFAQIFLAAVAAADFHVYAVSPDSFNTDVTTFSVLPSSKAFGLCNKSFGSAGATLGDLQKDVGTGFLDFLETDGFITIGAGADGGCGFGPMTFRGSNGEITFEIKENKPLGKCVRTIPKRLGLSQVTVCQPITQADFAIRDLMICQADGFAGFCES